jgi:hypothetical protein
MSSAHSAQQLSTGRTPPYRQATLNAVIHAGKLLESKRCSWQFGPSSVEENHQEREELLSRGYSALWSVYEQTFQRNLSPPSSGSKVSRGRNQFIRWLGRICSLEYVVDMFSSKTSVHMPTTQRYISENGDFITTAVRSSIPTKVVRLVIAYKALFYFIHTKHYNV